tara:strand:- start:358 stop:876 length:519 start_codon:yes stop_codon:yes gene_type:complete
MAIVAAVGAVVSAGATVVSAGHQKKAAKAQQRAADLEQRRQKLARARERSRGIREARIAAAQATQAGANQGVSGSSGVAGGVGSIISQGNANISFLDESGRLADQASEQLGKARSYTVRANNASAVAALGAQAFSAGGGFGAFSSGAKPTGASALSRNSFDRANAAGPLFGG